MWTHGESIATGVSGGAINAVLLAAGVDVSPASCYQTELRAALKRHKGNTTPAVRSALDAALPENVAAEISGRARIAVVKADGTSWASRRPLLIDTFEDTT